MSSFKKVDTSFPVLPFRAKLWLMIFCLGFYSLLSQILMLRELVVVFFGNELTLGAILGAWFIGISLGSLVLYRLVKNLRSSTIKWLIAITLILLAVLLPAQLVVVRILRRLLNTTFGEYIPFDAMLLSTIFIMLPTCLSIGLIFPCACQLAAEYETYAVSRIYALDALGSMLGGALFTFLFIYILRPFAIASLAGASTLLAAALIIPLHRTPVKRLLFLPALFLLLLACCPNCLVGIEQAAIRARWRAFGCLPDGEKHFLAELKTSIDSRYQNLAVIERENQMTLYGNGQVLFVFPDPIAGEHKIHFIMAQNPKANSVLLLGGNPVTYIPELLKYPLKELAHVELDQEITRILEKEAGESYLRAIEDSRVKQYAIDGPRYVKTCKKKYDVIIVDAPAPTTIALNRFFTVEFYGNIKRILSKNGFLYTTIESSPQLQDESARLSSSIYHSLKKEFNTVLVTAGTYNQFFAGMASSPITFEPEVLYKRSADANLKTDYFLPEYFLNADEISGEKLAFVEKRLTEICAPANTAFKPISTFYYLSLWNRFSGSQLSSFLNYLNRFSFKRAFLTILSAGFIFLIIGLLIRIMRNKKHVSAVSAGWFRGMLGIAVTSTGCCGIALELIIIFVFQNIFGYVYASIGLIVAMFMFGLTLGAICARKMKKIRQIWLSMIALDLLLLLLALAIPQLMRIFSKSDMLPVSSLLIQIAIYSLVVLIGWGDGGQFPVATRLIREAGGSTGSVAALANAADLFGSAIGGFIIGIFLIPILGIGASCILLGTLKCASLLCILSAWLVKVKPGYAAT